MAFIWIDKKDGEDLILASDINGIAKELINVGKDSAKKDLSNVDNETFKAKAEEAGVGGDAGLADEKNYMLFKDTADALPETANDGEVYKITNTTTSNLYVRHNGEWVEIWESGVTKSEMESYVEETLLGGEW